MAVTVSAAASFLTPVATPANLMVMGPGGYRFGDYWKLGLPLLVLFGVVAVLLVPASGRSEAPIVTERLDTSEPSARLVTRRPFTAPCRPCSGASRRPRASTTSRSSCSP